MKTKAIFPLSADPMHKGHIYEIESALAMFDQVHVIIGENSSKKYLFSISEREYLAGQSIRHFIRDENEQSRVTVGTLDGLLSTYSLINGYKHIIRGARNTKDFEYEQSIAEVFLELGIQTIILPSDNKLKAISSTWIKELSRYGAFVHQYVAPLVKQSLEERLSGRSIIGVTGSMGAGKSTFCKNLVDYARKNSSLEIDHIDIDKMVHSIYNGKEELYASTRRILESEFGPEMFDENGINRKKSAEILFKDPELEKRWTRLLTVPFMTKLETEINKRTGIILIDAAYIVEKGMMPLVNNNIILVTCHESKRLERIKKRDNLSEKEIECRTGLQLNPDVRKSNILKIQENDNQGYFYEYKNDNNYDEVIKELSENFPINIHKK